MKSILYVASEAAPFAMSGGLGDVMGALPKTIANLNKTDYDVRVVIPLYKCVSGSFRSKMKDECVYDVQLAWRNVYCGVKSLKADGVTWYFIDNEYYFNRDSLYGHYDDGERFAFFCLAVMEMLSHIGFYPDILHANDWQSALTVIYLKMKYGLVPDYSSIKSVFTIHNIEYQGKYGFEILGDVFSLEPSAKSVVEYSGCINLMKGAIQCCDYLTTVSPTYANEILSPEYSHGLNHIISLHRHKLSGILNGIDYESYDPKKDTSLWYNYNARQADLKASNKIEFQKSMSLPVSSDIPMYAMITRLVSHKGIDLVCDAADRLLANNVQLVILGTGDYKFESYFRGLENTNKKQVRSLIMFDKDMSRKLYASADFFIMPSKSEPCGLSQMIASRYGAVPITRETGGLADSIKGFWEDNGELMGNGFTFHNYSADELYDRIEASLALYSDKDKFMKFVRKIMKIDFSWKSSASKYIELYSKI